MFQQKDVWQTSGTTGTFAMEIPVQNSTKLEVAEALYGTNSGGDDT